MTNAEKYLKYGVDVKNFVTEYRTSNSVLLDEWLEAPYKLTLTEDEKIILKNINKNFYIIKRDNFGDLCIKGIIEGKQLWAYFEEFNHLFQFIKNEEEYEIKELLKGENKDECSR